MPVKNCILSDTKIYGNMADVESLLRKKTTSTETGRTMPNRFKAVICCGVKYSKNDPETYWCIDTDINKPIQKKYVGSDRVVKEVVDSYTCKKCGCLIVTVTRYGVLRGHRKILEREKLTGYEATDYLEATAKVRERQPLACPMQSVPFSKHVDFKYGKVLNSTTQRPRFLNEQDWAGEKIVNECRTIAS